ncbi:Alg9-like mannosyltransferase family-domain-containing protein [Dendryphion nanum]|uniref:Mannosyltransferase n=1 Tax=Dendryphion nanum TaxID=256645 RepID=A0A9P9IK78_9PLEO|nr:Alg9-like mannosyltransferase family-domain-containing protein [Dendryphion nanum]
MPASPSSLDRHRYRDATLGTFALLLAFRIVNALTLRTFFQPDEFFQSLEPAWQLAFGQSSNAWITWEWRSQLRSSLHPEIFAAVYLVADRISRLLGLGLPNRADLLIASPKVAQAVFAALLDFYTWKLAEKVYGRGSRTAVTSLALSICSPWQWFCSTRTLSNCLETTLSSIAVYYWPWHWPAPAPADVDEKNHRHVAQDDKAALGSVTQLRMSLVLAACACILRPTNVLIWLPVSLPTLWQTSSRQRYLLVREISICGSAVLACSVLSDRAYYKAWTLPPFRFLYFNIAQSLAVFYGRNRPDYYLTEGLPLLLTTALPFAIVGSWQALRPTSSLSRSSKLTKETDSPSQTITERIPRRLAYTSIVVTLSLSLIAHKEVRFLYPILPFLHLLAASPLSTFTSSPSPARKLLLSTLLFLNILLAIYTSQYHQRGVLDVLTHLRHTHESYNANLNSNPDLPHHNTTVAFLMPCHSTPWRSHLVHPSISAWALTCEPPLNIPLSDRPSYLDEADQFYASPRAWLRANMEDVSTITRSGSRSGGHWARHSSAVKRAGRRAWPSQLVFFGQLENDLGGFLGATVYRECWRGWNSHWHDDWRRVGDVVVWCLDGGLEKGSREKPREERREEREGGSGLGRCIGCEDEGL